jgi:serine/threonine protein kinase/thioredoxin-like negative regulator of GroEL
MNEEESIFGTEPDRLMRLMRSGLEADESEVANGADQTALAGSFTEQPGTRIGRYKLLRILGEGGMGIVYLAEQQGSIRRRVALKVIKPGMDSKRVLARFEAERQALALLDHLNVANIYDAGTTEAGRPYFVMEYVKGLPITEYCDHHRLSINERLRLFQQVCHAVQHAHQKGIIHRDIKPSNILVSTQDDKAVPKIIDFGVAKAISQPLTERTLVTEDSQLLGTPEYMSPEQADMAGEDIDTRSDIYSLGVLLYVLLTGVLPFDSTTFREGGIEHIRQIIRETDPKTPSTRLSKLGDEAKTVAESRRTEVAALTKCLHRELEWIPLKAMRKERAERYRSASELSDDIENYLKGEPLMAGPPTAGYRLRKFLRRHKALVSGIAAVLVVSVIGTIVSVTFALGQARALAENQLITDFLQNDVLGSADKARVDEATVTFILDAATETLDEGKFKEKPLIEASIYRTLGETYWKLGEYKKAEQHLLHAIRIYRQHHGDEHLDTLGTEFTMGWVYEQQGRYGDMERLWTRILAIEQRVSSVQAQLASMNGLAMAYYRLGKYEEAESLFHKILQTVQREVGKENVPRLPFWKSNLATVYTAQGQYEEAERLFMQVQTSLERDEDQRLAELANLYREQGQYDKAETLFVKTLETQRQRRGDKHFFTVYCMERFVRLYVDQDRYEEAEKLFSEALPIARRRLREDHPVTLQLVNTLAVLRTKQKQYNEAEGLFDEALKGKQRELGEDHPDTLESKNDLAVLYKVQARYEEAEPLLLEAVEGRRLKLGDQHPHTLESINNLIALYEAWNKPEKAEEWRAKLPQTEAKTE